MKKVSPRYRTLFPYKPDPMPRFLRHTLRSRIHNLGLFWGPQKQEKQNNYHSTTLGAKNKLRGNFIWEKLMDFLLFNKVFQNFIFSNFNLLQTFNDYGLLRMGPTFLKSFFNFQIFQVFKSMLGWVIVSGFWILDKKNTSKKISVKLMWESHEQLEPQFRAVCTGQKSWLYNANIEPILNSKS